MSRRPHLRPTPSSSTPSTPIDRSTAATTTAATTTPFALTSLSSPHTRQSVMSLQRETDSWKIEAKREKAMRRIERTKSEQTEARLRRQISFLMEESEQSRETLEAMRVRHEEDMEELSSGKRLALEQLREAELRVLRLEADRPEAADDGGDAFWRSKCDHLSRVAESFEAETEGVKRRWREELAAATAEGGSDPFSAPPAFKKTKPSTCAVSPAPPDVLSELNRVRVALANSQTQERILTRKVGALSSKVEELESMKESKRVSERSLLRAERRCADLQKKVSSIEAAEERWEEWRGEMMPIMKGYVSEENTDEAPTPPEAATIVRTLKTLEEDRKKLCDNNAELVSELKSARIDLDRLKKEQANTKMELASKTKRIVEIEDELKTEKSQSNIWQREARSMRDLACTFQNSKEGTTTTMDGETPQFHVNRISLESERERNETLSKFKDRLEAKHKDLEAEHERVLGKFQKLKEALMKERADREAAETRAETAETMAGKGDFNERSARALHLKRNPLMEAVRAKYEKEIEELKRAAVVRPISSGGDSSEGGSVNTSIAMDSIDAQKLHKRLKESFKEQIGVFREGVYLLTGLKVDMSVEKSRPMFKVRSMFGEREEDHLLFAWPNEIKDTTDVRSLDLLDTLYAQEAMKSDCFEYIKRFDSIPAFMAALTLDLFEKTTLV